MKNERLLSLDVFRGITIAGMILVNNPGSWSTIYPPLKHAQWHGVTPTDLIFPFFLFIVGVAITLSLSKRKARGDDQQKLILQIIRRSATLFLLGLILSGFPYFNLETIRIPGVLQRIAVVYLFASILFLKTNLKTQVYLSAAFLILYFIAMAFIPVPGVGAANFEPTTNLAAYFDNLLLGGHLWSSTKVWDPEGILSTIPAIVSAMMGVFTGELLLTQKSREEKTSWMFFGGVVAMFLGYVWNGWFPINKNIWTSSYVLYTGGLALLFLAFCYWLIDVQGYKKWAKPFQVYGLNAITVFFLSGIVGRLLTLIKVSEVAGQEISLKQFLYDSLFLSWLEPINASLLWAVSYIFIWLGLMWILYAKKIFIKV